MHATTASRDHRTQEAPCGGFRQTLLTALMTVACLPLGAATIVVNSTGDTITDEGACTLREAIISANSNAPSGATPGECVSGSSGSTDTIQLPGGTISLSLSGAESNTTVLPEVGDLDITQNLNLVGQGSSATFIDGLNLGSRVLHIDSATVTVSLSGVTIRNGSTTGDGGGLYFEDGISLTLTDVIFDGNSAGDDGGGLFATNTANATIVDCRFTDNEADGHGAGMAWYECVGCSALLKIDRSQFDLNRTTGSFFSNGGGLIASDGTIIITNSIFDGNHSDDKGGGLLVQGDLTMRTTTISNNDADAEGGGIFFDYHVNSDLENCTVSGNSALEAGGGLSSFSNDETTLVNCTVAANTAPIGSAVDGADEFIFANTIVSGVCAGGLAASLGGNLESPGDNCGFAHGTDQVAVSGGSLALAALANNGGRTETHLLGSSSAALGSGREAYCPLHDQRSVPRPMIGDCDSGAVEGTVPVIFADHFEEGNTTAWTSVAP